MTESNYDWIIIGSGFGGSVSALRLAEKGHRVLVIEKGRRFAPTDFPESNWDLRRWMWMPEAGLRGIFQMSFFEHVTILHGVGVGGGSLVYANTLPTPKDDFFDSPSWAHLADWKRELAPHYATARRMLGAARNPLPTQGDEILQSIAKDIGRSEHFHPTDVAVYFGAPGKRVPDPYFEGRGPDRVGCTFCGACMTGCRVGAKNTLDRNYLYLAERLGVRVLPETEVVAVRPSSSGGYDVETRASFATRPQLGTPPRPEGGLTGFTRRLLSRSRDPNTHYRAPNVVFAGGVLGTVPLLLAMQQDRTALPNLSPRLGHFVRTNSEALIGVVTPDASMDLSRGIAITSILHTDDHSHIEPVRYSAGSGFFRTMVLPHSPGDTLASRLGSALRGFLAQPAKWARAWTVPDFAKQSQVLLYMRTLEGTLRLELGRNAFTAFRRGLVSRLPEGSQPPSAFMPEATDLARRFAARVGGVEVTLLTETLLGVPSTAHILGGSCMGATADEGVIDAHHRVHNYPGLYVIDGSAVSANPGVNPALTITALAERCWS